MSTVLGFFLLLAPLIFFHELGHFIFAKLTGVRVLTFSIGFGPRLFGFQRGDTDYRVSLFPLGGYVKMYGDNFMEEVPEDQKQYAFLEKGYWAKLSIAAAGPVFNFILPVIVLTGFFVGEQQRIAPVIQTVLPRAAADLAGIKAGDRILKINETAIDDFVQLQELISKHPNEELQIQVLRDSQKVQIPLTPKSSEIFRMGDSPQKVGRIGVSPFLQAALIKVAPNSAAAEAGLLDKDRILQINSQKVTSMPQMQELMSQIPLTENIHLKVQRRVFETLPQTPAKMEELNIEIKARELSTVLKINPKKLYYTLSTEEKEEQNLLEQIVKYEEYTLQFNKRLQQNRGMFFAEGSVTKVEEKSAAKEISLNKGDVILAVDGQGFKLASQVSETLMKGQKEIHTLLFFSGKELKIAAFRMKARPEWGMEDIHTFGVQLMSLLESPVRETYEVSLPQAFTRAVSSTGALISKTWHQLTILLSGKVSAKALGGPLTIAKIAGVAIDQGLDRFIEIFCFISINLGLMNLLPIPVLDGGHIFTFTLEAIMRKKLSIKAKTIASMAGLALLLSFMAFAMLNDVIRAVM